MVSMQEVIENGLIEDFILETLPNNGVCWCGSEFEFTDTLKQVCCTNPKCFLKVAARLESMAKMMKADGWGFETCKTVVQETKMKSPYQVFLLEGTHSKMVAGYEKKVKSICSSKYRDAKLWEVVKYGNIPGVSTIAFKIFNGYETMQDAFKDIEKYQVPFIAEKLGIKDSSTGVMAYSVYSTLLEYKDELLFGEKKFRLQTSAGETRQIAITGGVHGYANKSEFIRFLNDRYSGKAVFVLGNSVTSKTYALIADGDTGSSKYRNAQKFKRQAEEKGTEPIIIAESKEFVVLMDKLYE